MIWECEHVSRIGGEILRASGGQADNGGSGKFVKNAKWLDIGTGGQTEKKLKQLRQQW